MKNLKLLIILIFLTNCSDNTGYLTDLEKLGLTGEVKSLKLVNQSDFKNDEDVVRTNNELFFNKEGMITEQREYQSNKLRRINTFIYNERNLLVFKNYYDESKKLVNKSIFENEINDNGRLIKQSELQSLTIPIVDSTNMEYDLFPEEIIKYLYDENGNLYQYDTYQRITSKWKDIIFLKNGCIVKNTYMYTVDGEKFSETDFKCLENDKYNNCTKYEVIDNDQTKSFLKFDIEYYK